MNAQDIDKTAVITPIRFFAYVLMAFGLHNAAQTMQRVSAWNDLEFVSRDFSNTPVTTSTSSFLQMPKHHVRFFKPVSTTRHDSSSVFVSDDLVKESHVFLRIDRVLKTLKNLYASPFKVLSRTEKVFIVEFDGIPTTISIDTLRAMYPIPDEVAPKITPPVLA
ncbi:hypothetical protein AVEN_233505-1 [Araneus ventricosus]|uniref:Uncharacterized protein n=1 Tax=Araneus ventricosus TaxID=182803 RepID=A0A4Y2PHC0_ARAVE|nr:hypothetical protein AVEN_233505-1 [Araneus ventricosus]